MGFKPKRRGGIFGISPAKEKKNLMTKIAIMLDEDRIEEAYPLLDEAVKKYPNEDRLWDMYAFVGSELGITTVMQKAFAKLTHFQPNEPDNWHNLGVVYAMEAYPALASRAFREFVRRFPFDSRKKASLEMVEVAEKQIEGLLEAYKIPNDKDGMKIAVLHDRVQLYMHQREYEKSIRTAEELIKKAPDFIATYNNLSLVYFMKGDVEKAVETAETALTKQPENFHALGNLARFLAFLGKKEKAYKFANKLRELESEFSDIYSKKIEAFAFLGDDESVVDVYREIEKEKIELNDEGYIKNLAAFSFYQLGDEKKAKTLWEDAVEDDYEDADENLDELTLPVYERNIFALGLSYWLPYAYTQELMELTKNIRDDDDFDENLKNKINGFFDKYPYIVDNFPIILERAEESGKELIINIANWSENPKALEILKEFALSNIGSDSIRSKAAMYLSNLKVLPKKVKQWVKGEQTEIVLKSFFITGEAVENNNYPMKPEAIKLLQKGLEAMQKGDLEISEEFYRKALEIQSDHPVLLNNLLVVRQMKGEKFDHEKEIRDLHSLFPDYFFGAMSMGMLEVQNGNVDKAKEILEKFDDKEEWHITEFNMYSKLQIEICLEQKLFEGARSWLDQMKQFHSGFDLTEKDEAGFKEIESRIEMTELLDKMPSTLGKLFGSRKKKKTKKK